MQPPTKLWNQVKSVFKPRPSPEEENAQCIALAEQLDKLVSQPGWEKVLEHAAERVNRTISEAATTDVTNPYHQTIHVIRWNAQRELLDEVLNFVQSTRKQRDEIQSLKREEEEYEHSIRNSR